MRRHLDRLPCWRSKLAVVAAAAASLLVGACAEAEDSGQGVAEHPVESLPPGESAWHLRMTPDTRDGRVSVRLFPRAEAPVEGEETKFSPLDSVEYELSFERSGEKLRRCSAKDGSGDFVTVSCTLQNGVLALSFGRAEEGRIVMHLQPEKRSDGVRWVGEAVMDHPSLPMDVTIGSVEMVPAAGHGAAETDGKRPGKS